MTKQYQDKPHPLQNFSILPNSAFVRVRCVMALFGCSKSTILRMVAAGQLKTYKHTPRTTTFNVGELRKVLEAKVGG